MIVLPLRHVAIHHQPIVVVHVRAVRFPVAEVPLVPVPGVAVVVAAIVEVVAVAGDDSKQDILIQSYSKV